MPRWLAVGLGCVTALGMQALFGGLAGLTPLAGSQLLTYVVLFLALVVGGFVTGYLVGRFQPLYGALAAIVFILLTVTFQASREAIFAREFGLQALPPIDFVQLTITDVLAMTGASIGGWLASRFAA